nr:hypothetical protein [Bacteroidota bacterium]
MKIKFILFFLTAISLIFSSCNSTPESDETVQSISSPESPSTTDSSLMADITCPECGFTKTETLPVEVCQISYT